MVNGHNRIEAHQPGNYDEQLGGAERGLRPDLEADCNLASVHLHPAISA